MTTLDTAECFKVLTHYEIHCAHGTTPEGTDVRIAGRTDSGGGKTLAIGDASLGIERMLPLDAAGAQFLAENTQAHHHRGASEARRRMLEHLYLRISDFFEQAGISDFNLTARLHENSYTVVEAWMTAPAPIHLKERLSPHARDRKGADYHPTGRQ